jgi:GntR family transcriptional repressor for pyruvate dehydrogenase complex
MPPKNPLQSDAFTPIKLERVSQKVANQLKKVISDGIFRVGDRLPSERELAEQMGVSRPSVREAIQQLEMLGMLETVHGGGSVVKNLTERELSRPFETIIDDDRQLVLQLTEVRAFMEAWAARQAALKRTEDELHRIRSFLEEMERDFSNGEIRYEIDFKFHAEIASSTQNTIYVHLIDSIYHLINYSVKVHREEMFVARSDQETILNHHRRIYEAIENGDPDAAEKAMNDHLLFVVGEFTTRFMTDTPDAG